MQKRNVFHFITLLFILTFWSCSDKEKEVIAIVKPSLSGNIQKGPFLNGTSLVISELDSKLQQTGKTYSSNIVDNLGSFELKNTSFLSPFVELKADGFYFNEVKNVASTSRLVLSGLSDLTDKTTINVNVLTHLEKTRVESLISQGKTFKEAKAQAQKEILTIFDITKTDIKNSEELDISKNTEDNAILLAISCILQGFRTDAELSELLANINTDLRTDGVLSDATFGSELINSAKLLNLTEIRANIEKRYQSLGIATTIPPFEKYIQNFVAKTKFVFTKGIIYPAKSALSGKENLLNVAQTTYISDAAYILYANVPQGRSVKVKISASKTFDWYFPAFQENTGWTYSEYNESENSRFFTTNRSGLVEFQVQFKALTKIEVFEDNATTPTFTRTITPKEYSAADFPAKGQFGDNLLALRDGNKTIKNNSIYSIAVEFSNDITHTFEITYYFEKALYELDKSKNSNWVIEEENGNLKFSVKGKGIKADIPIKLIGNGKVPNRAFLDGKDVYISTFTY